MGKFVRPAESLILADANGGGGPQYVLADVYYCCGDPHNDGGNAAFADGHAKWGRVAFGPMNPPWPAPNAGSLYYSCHVDQKLVTGVW
jgi:prepilin-type processing-associated H-X9-DG protein